MTFGQMLRKQRMIKGITLEQLSIKCGVSKNAICKYEHDVLLPNTVVFNLLIDILEIDVSLFCLEYIYNLIREGKINIGLILRSNRREIPLTLVKLSSELHISMATLSGYERSQKIPTFYNFKIISNYFNIDYSKYQDNEQQTSLITLIKKIESSPLLKVKCESLLQEMKNKLLEIISSGVNEVDINKEKIKD